MLESIRITSIRKVMSTENTALLSSIRSRKRKRSSNDTVFKIDEEEFIRSIIRFFEMELGRPIQLMSVIPLIDKLHNISKSRMKGSTSSSGSHKSDDSHEFDDNRKSDDSHESDDNRKSDNSHESGTESTNSVKSSDSFTIEYEFINTLFEKTRQNVEEDPVLSEEERTNISRMSARFIRENLCSFEIISLFTEMSPIFNLARYLRRIEKK